MNPLIPWDGKRDHWVDGASVGMATAAVETGGELAQSKKDASGTLPNELGSAAKVMPTEH